MYNIKDFIFSGSSIYGVVGGLLGALAGLAIGLVIALPGMLGALIEPWISLYVLAIIPVTVLISTIIGAIAGVIIGGLRAALIGNALIIGRGWLVAILAIVIAVAFSDIVSGLALFLIWRTFRHTPLTDFNHVGFFKILIRYILIYAMLFFVVGLIAGSGLGGFLSWAINESNDYSAINNAVQELAQFMDSFYLEAGADTAQGIFSAGISGAMSQDLNQIDLQSSVNLANESGTIFSYEGAVNSEINDFVGSVQGIVEVEQQGLTDSFSFIQGEVLNFFNQFQTNSGVVASSVSGGLIGAALAVVYSSVFSTIMCIMDFWVVKNVINKKSPFDSFPMMEDTPADSSEEYLESAEASARGKKK